MGAKSMLAAWKKAALAMATAEWDGEEMVRQLLSEADAIGMMIPASLRNDLSPKGLTRLDRFISVSLSREMRQARKIERAWRKALKG